MPLELGMAMARRFIAPEDHDWLVLVPKGHAYLQFISDLAAYDLAGYESGSLNGVVKAVVAWLTTRREGNYSITPREVLSKLPSFQAVRRELDAAWRGSAPWRNVVIAATEIAKSLG